MAISARSASALDYERVFYRESPEIHRENQQGFGFWFKFIINPGVEPTNNRADRALRRHVVLRKILGTLRNDKGTSIHERIMTTLATWGLKGLNSIQMLTVKLES